MNVAEIINNLSLNNFERLSLNWDNHTTNVLLVISGSSNYYGGGGTYLHICVHGVNSITPNKFEVLGYAVSGYNIARTYNSVDSAYTKYYKNQLSAIGEPTYDINVSGSCCTGSETLLAILNAKKDFLVNIK